MWGKCSPSLASQKGKKLHWVICKTCQAWYHNVCVGLSEKLTTLDEFSFSCCTLPASPEDDIVYVIASYIRWLLFSLFLLSCTSAIRHPPTVRRGMQQSQLTIRDIQSIYPWNGISDGVVDFYIRSVSGLIVASCRSWLSYYTQ